MTRVLPDLGLLKIPESNNNGGYSIDSMYLHGFSGSGSSRGGTVPTSGWLGGACAPGAPLLLPPMVWSWGGGAENGN